MGSVEPRLLRLLACLLTSRALAPLASQGMIAAMLWRGRDAASLSLEQVVRCALSSARQRVDSGAVRATLDELVEAQTA